MLCLLDAPTNFGLPALLPEIDQFRPALARLPRIPDLLTTANLTCGAASLLFSSQGQLTIACWLVFLAAVFDVFDGLAARALGGGSELGKQLDSLADLVSFGVAPAFALWTFVTASAPDGMAWAAAAACWLCIASAWRLAKFNVDTRQSSGFLGLPTPANGMCWASLLLIASGSGMPGHALASALRTGFTALITMPMAACAAALLLGVLMLSELPLPSLKFKHGGWKGNEVIFLLIGGGAVLLPLFGLIAVPLLLILYLLSPFWGKCFPKPL